MRSRIFGHGNWANRSAIRRVVQLHEGVVDLLEADALLHQLPRHVVVAVDVDLARERRPRLQANVHEPQFLVEVVVVEDALRHRPRSEARTPVAGGEFERAARLHDAEHADQSVGERRIVESLPGPGVFVDRTGMELVTPTGSFGRALGVLDQTIRPTRRDRLEELGPSHLQDAVDEPLELVDAADREIAFDNHPVEAGENPGDEAGEFGGEGGYCLHGIRGFRLTVW
jgi:hypothetical protein